VLTNDTDVDKYGETLTVGTITATGTETAFTAGGSSVTFSAVNGSASIKSGDYVYYATGSTTGAAIYALYDSAHNAITLSSGLNGSTVNLSAPVAYYKSGSTYVAYTFHTGDLVTFDNVTTDTALTSSQKTSTVGTSQTSSTLTLTTSSNIAVGMTVTGGAFRRVPR